VLDPTDGQFDVEGGVLIGSEAARATRRTSSNPSPWRRS
jgi:hypothetical protein